MVVSHQKPEGHDYLNDWQGLVANQRCLNFTELRKWIKGMVFAAAK